MEDVKKQELMTRKQAAKILGAFDKVSPKQKEALTWGAWAVLACPHCLGQGIVWSDIKPNGPYRSKRSIKGTYQFGNDCPLCLGSGKLDEVHCVSCGKTEDAICGKKNLVHCLKCYESLERKGYL